MAGEPVLVVDDNLANMKLMSFLLGKRGYQVRSASSAKDALEVLRDFSPRLILMDLQMAGVDGFALTRQLKAATATRDIVVIAVTANAMKGDEQRALEAGCDDYVTKPIDTRALPALVAAHLSKPRRAAR
jgi:two-component system cell cycle response regulator DivK